MKESLNHGGNASERRFENGLTKDYFLRKSVRFRKMGRPYRFELFVNARGLVFPQYSPDRLDEYYIPTDVISASLTIPPSREVAEHPFYV
jgi:hypothetical protein